MLHTWVHRAGLAQGKEHFFLIKQKGISSKDLPLLIFPCELVANWHRLLNTFVEPVLDALHMLFPPRSARKAKPPRPPHPAAGPQRPPDEAQCRGTCIKLIIAHVSFFCL